MFSGTSGPAASGRQSYGSGLMIDCSEPARARREGSDRRTKPALSDRCNIIAIVQTG
jgi:hypothetical protein